MADKKFSAVISIGAELGASFRSTFGGLDSRIKSVGASLRGLNDSQKSIAGYAKALESVKQARAAMAEQGRQLMALRGQVASTQDIKALAELDKQIQAQEKSYEKARAALTKQTATLDKQREALKAAGIDTSNLSAEMERLGKESATASNRLAALGKVKGITAELTASFKKLAVEAAATGVALTAAGVPLWKTITGFANMGDEAQETAAALGTTARELMALRFAGERVGVETGKMDAALNKLNQALAEAQDGGGKASEAFERLGLDAEMLAELPLGQRMEVLADAFKNVRDPLERTRIATELFGAKAYKMANVLGMGADELRRLREEGEKTGFILDEKQLALTAEFDEAFGRFKATLTGIRNEIGAALLPVVNRFLTFMSENTLLVKGVVAGFAVMIGVTAVAAVAKLGFTVVATAGKVWQLVAAMRALGAIEALGQAGGVAGLGNAVKAALPWLARFGAMLAPIATGIKSIGLALAIAFGATPVGWIVAIGAALAGVALAVLKFWEPIKAFFSGLWAGFKDGFGDAFSGLQPLVTLLNQTLGPALKWVGGLFAKLFEPIRYTKDELAGVASVGQTVGKAIGVVAGAINILINPIARLAKLVELVRSGLSAIGIGSAPAQAGGTPAPSARMPSVPVASSTRNSATATTNNSIVVNAAPGMDERKLAQEIERRLRERDQQQQRAALYDVAPAY